MLQSFYVFYDLKEVVNQNFKCSYVQKINCHNKKEAEHFFNIKFNNGLDFNILKIMNNVEYSAFLKNK